MTFAFDSVPGFEGLLLVRWTRRADERGWFEEAFRSSAFAAAGIPAFVQANRSVSARGVVRGLHYQIPPHGQAKFVRCTRGALFDIAVDLRPASLAFGQSYSVRLAADDPVGLYIPAGFAHGFQALEDATEMEYFVTAEYDRESERSIRFDDADLAIHWPLKAAAVAAKDLAAPAFANAHIPEAWP